MEKGPGNEELDRLKSRIQEIDHRGFVEQRNQSISLRDWIVRIAEKSGIGQ